MWKKTSISKNISVKYTFLSLLASGINLITIVVFGRVFSVPEYGIITTLQAAVSNISVIMIPLQIIICKKVSCENGHKKEGLYEIIIFFCVSNLIITLLMIIFGRMAISFFNLTRIFDYIVFIVLIILYNLFLVLNGVVQGKSRFLLLGWTSVILYSVKMVFGILLGVTGMGPVAVLISFLVAIVICIYIYIKKMPLKVEIIEDQWMKKEDWTIVSDIIKASIVNLMVSFYMNNGDLLLGRLYLSEEVLGQYSVAINLSKIGVFLIAAPVATLILPKIAACGHDKKAQRHLIIIAETVVLIISCGYSVFLWAFSSYIIRVLYGIRYMDSIKYITPCIIFSIILGVFWVYYQYAFATDRLKLFSIITLVSSFAVIAIILYNRVDLSYIPLYLSFGMIFSMGISFFYGLIPIFK